MKNEIKVYPISDLKSARLEGYEIKIPELLLKIEAVELLLEESRQELDLALIESFSKSGNPALRIKKVIEMFELLTGRVQGVQ